MFQPIDWDQLTVELFIWNSINGMWDKASPIQKFCTCITIHQREEPRNWAHICSKTKQIINKSKEKSDENTWFLLEISRQESMTSLHTVYFCCLATTSSIDDHKSVGESEVPLCQTGILEMHAGQLQAALLQRCEQFVFLTLFKRHPLPTYQLYMKSNSLKSLKHPLEIWM